MSEKRDVHLFLADMDNAIHRILLFSRGISYEDFFTRPEERIVNTGLVACH